MWHPLALWYCQILPGMDSEKLRLAGPEIIMKDVTYIVIHVATYVDAQKLMKKIQVL